MNAVFVELPAFRRHLASHLSEVGFAALQRVLMSSPEIGDVIQGAGGLRKLRFADARRGKGRRGGLRVIYFWWSEGCQFWLFAIYGKGEVSDLTPEQRGALGAMLKAELKARKS